MLRPNSREGRPNIHSGEREFTLISSGGSQTQTKGGGNLFLAFNFVCSPPFSFRPLAHIVPPGVLGFVRTCYQFLSKIGSQGGSSKWRLLCTEMAILRPGSQAGTVVRLGERRLSGKTKQQKYGGGMKIAWGRKWRKWRLSGGNKRVSPEEKP